ncbi:MAG: hypothetical protein OHK0039_31580 [Bacteroidia bacterium]
MAEFAHRLVGWLRQIALVAGLLLGQMASLYAQCSQCKAAAATEDGNGGLIIGASMNAGVLYLLCTPMLLVLAMGLYWWYKARQHRQAQQS